MEYWELSPGTRAKKLTYPGAERGTTRFAELMKIVDFLLARRAARRVRHTRSQSRLVTGDAIQASEWILIQQLSIGSPTLARLS